MNFVEFCESIIGCELPEWQKIFLNDIHDKIKTGERLYYKPARGQQKTDPIPLILYLTAMYEYYELDSGVTKNSNKKEN